MAQRGEPSVEEILESIKKVMARDNRELAIETRRANSDGNPGFSAQPLLAENQEDDVLDLAEMECVEETALENAAKNDSDYDAGARQSGADISDSDPQLTTEKVRGAMRDNLEALAMLAEPGARPQICLLYTSPSPQDS